MASSTRPQSSAVRAMGPSLSSVQQRAMAPWRLTPPGVGRRPVTPQLPEGERMEPQVSDPMAKGTRPADTAAPEPDDDPPDHPSGLHGVVTGPGHDALGGR